MAPLSGLPNDILVEILARTVDLQDLHSAILSCRTLSGAFYERRALLLSLVLRREIRSKKCGTDSEKVYKCAFQVADRLKDDRFEDAIIIFEAIEPMMRYSTSRPHHYMLWCMRLHQFYVQCGPKAREKSLALLERVYAGFLKHQTNFDPDVAYNEAGVAENLPSPGRSYLPKVCQAAALCLAKEYARRRRHADRLAVQQQIFRRVPLDQPASHEWASYILATYRELQDPAAAIRFSRSMYRICQTANLTAPMLIWARHLIAEHERGGHAAAALAEQQRVLADLERGSAEYIAWARVLITKYRRIGRSEPALALKAEVWTTMNVRNACYFGWARELADDHRRAGQEQQALEVVRRMHEETQRELARNEKDVEMQFHGRQAALALVNEYELQHKAAEALALRSEVLAGDDRFGTTCTCRLDYRQSARMGDASS